jgi:hypothetical protein
MGPHVSSKLCFFHCLFYAREQAAASLILCNSSAFAVPDDLRYRAAQSRSGFIYLKLKINHDISFFVGTKEKIDGLTIRTYALEGECVSDRHLFWMSIQTVKLGGCGMKWYYKWKLRNIQKEINELQELSSHRLIEDYTPNSRLRILDRLEKRVQEQLAQVPASSVQN